MKKYLLVMTISFCLIILFKQANSQENTDTVSFETPTTKIIIDTTDNNLWQIGRPQKTFFDSAYSASNAILTDTINSYPTNDTSSFVYVINLTGSCLTCMDFWHKYDMDSVSDKGIIEASYDSGNSWFILKDTAIDSQWSTSYFTWQWDYHLNTGVSTEHQLIANGKSDGWIHSYVCWQWWIPVKTDSIIINPDSLMIRFTFISDSILKNRDGWMIDNLVATAAPWDGCSGIKENSVGSIISLLPNPFYSQTMLRSEKILNNATLTLFNSFGQLVKKINNISGLTITLQRDNLQSGLYFLRLSQDNIVIASDKLIIIDN